MQCWINLKLCVVAGDSSVNCSLLVCCRLHMCVSNTVGAVRIVSFSVCLSVSVSGLFLTVHETNKRMYMISITGGRLGSDEPPNYMT